MSENKYIALDPKAAGEDAFLIFTVDQDRICPQLHVSSTLAISKGAFIHQKQYKTVKCIKTIDLGKQQFQRKAGNRFLPAFCP